MQFPGCYQARRGERLLLRQGQLGLKPGCHGPTRQVRRQQLLRDPQAFLSEPRPELPDKRALLPRL
jgi:hypothetical protein